MISLAEFEKAISVCKEYAAQLKVSAAAILKEVEEVESLKDIGEWEKVEKGSKIEIVANHSSKHLNAGDIIDVRYCRKIKDKDWAVEMRIWGKNQDGKTRCFDASYYHESGKLYCPVVFKVL